MMASVAVPIVLMLAKTKYMENRLEDVYTY